MASLARMLAGRKRVSGVWDYFEYKGDIGKSKCLVTDAKGKVCGLEFAGKNPTNLKSHMKQIHPAEYAELDESEIARKKQNVISSSSKSSATERLLTLQEFMANRDGRWPVNSTEFQQRMKAVESWIIATGCPLTYIDVLEFKIMLNTCDRKFVVPGK